MKNEIIRKERVDRPIVRSLFGEIRNRQFQYGSRIPANQNYFYSETGLSVLPKANLGSRELTVKGKKVVFDNILKIDFVPGSRASLKRSEMTDSLTKGIEGIMDLLDAIDQGELLEPVSAIIVGTTTHINMALIAQRLGFVIVDECRTPDGNIDKSLKSFTVVGKLEDIRARVEEFKKAGVDQKLAQRNRRLQLKPTPVTA